MRDTVRVDSHRLLKSNVFGVILGLLLFLSGCAPTPATQDSKKSDEEKANQLAESRILRNLQNALESLRPEKLGIVSGEEQAVAVLNEWAKGAKAEAEKRGEGWKVHRPHDLLKSLPKEWIEQVSQDQFVQRDTMYLRDCLWASQATRFGAGKAEKDLDVVVNLFEFVIRNLSLIPPGSRRVPVGPFDAMVLGRGTAVDRAWVFAELLRQRSVDSVILSPRGKAGEKSSRSEFLIGVLFEKDILLFDPTLGLPVAADVSAPKSAMPRLPVSLRQLRREPELLAAINRDSSGSFTLTAEMLEAPQVELICHSEHLAARMQRLQAELSGEHSVIVSDPLEDSQDSPGLWSRVVKHPAAVWSADDVAIWPYPEIVRESAARMTPEQQKELLKLSQSLAAPIRIQSLRIREDGKGSDIEFARPDRTLMKQRMEHIVGRWTEAIPGYLAAQLYDVDPPTDKAMRIVSSDGKQSDEIAVVSATEKRNLRLMMMQPQYSHVRSLHLLAGDDACFWLAQCQFEQNRWQLVVDQCDVYANQHSSGGWVIANQLLKATALAKQKKLNEAIRALNAIEEDDPASGGFRVLIARWQRLLETE